jgi:hypothetical protein
MPMREASLDVPTRAARHRGDRIAVLFLVRRVSPLRHEWDLGAAPTNVRSWESNGLKAYVAFGPFMTPSATSARNFCCDAQRRSGATVW